MCVYIYIYICIYVCRYMCIYIYIYTHIHRGWLGFVFASRPLEPRHLQEAHGEAPGGPPKKIIYIYTCICIYIYIYTIIYIYIYIYMLISNNVMSQ